MIRKKGRLPGTVIRMKYQKECGADELEMQIDGPKTVKKGDTAIVVDDLLATGDDTKTKTELCTSQEFPFPHLSLIFWLARIYTLLLVFIYY